MAILLFMPAPLIEFPADDAGRRGQMNQERDPAHPTRDELRETAASEALMATEEETDPSFEDDRDPADVPDAEMG